MKIDPLPPLDDSFWARLRATPLVDLLRGRVTGRLDVRRVIAEAKLPEPLSGFIYQTVVTARRRRRTRFDLARSLVERCQTDLALGCTPEELVLSLDDSRKINLYSMLGVNLPTPIATLIQRVVRRTRLWQAERIDVARELAEHFRDGLATGQTPDQLIESFGDPRRAARLIRRAKLRNRPLAWRIWRRAMQGISAVMALILVSYLVLFARFVLVRPTLTHNYALELTAPARSVPEADRAWPLYREALLRLTPMPKLNSSPETRDTKKAGDEPHFFGIVPTDLQPYKKPGSEPWKQVVNWLDTNRGTLEIARKAAARPRLAFMYGDPSDKTWLESMPEFRTWMASKANHRDGTESISIDVENNPPIGRMLLPQFYLRRLENLLNLDAFRAVVENDPASFVADVVALVGLADQLHNDMPLLELDIFSFRVLTVAMSLVDDVLVKNPGLLSNANLERLAHAIAGYGGGDKLYCRLDGERLLLRDIYQRMYTDDGNGDGRLTREGLKLICSWQDDLNTVPSFSTQLPLPKLVVGPAYSAWLLSRHEMTAKTEELFDRMEKESRRPLWQKSNSRPWDDLLHLSRLEQDRYAPILIIMPVMEVGNIPAERTTQQRDATLTALALELYHRQHGQWPKDLSDLVPDLLPTIPLDRFTGEPLRYRVIDDRPLLYSTGRDQDDDGGRAIKNLGEMFYSHVDGDWILWPPQQSAEK